jgi:hypothetical protein
MRPARAAFEQEFAARRVVSRLWAGEGVEPEGLSSAGVRLAKGHPVGEFLVLAAVEMDLELVTGLVVEAGLNVRTGHRGVDVHHEHRAVLAPEQVEIVDVELAVLGR